MFRLQVQGALLHQATLMTRYKIPEGLKPYFRQGKIISKRSSKNKTVLLFITLLKAQNHQRLKLLFYKILGFCTVGKI